MVRCKYFGNTHVEDMVEQVIGNISMFEAGSWGFFSNVYEAQLVEDSQRIPVW